MKPESQSENSAPNGMAQHESAPEIAAKTTRQTPDEIAANAAGMNEETANAETVNTKTTAMTLPAAKVATLPVAATDDVIARSPLPASPLSDQGVEGQMRRMSRRSFLSGALAVGAAYGGWRWLATRRLENGIPWPLRRNLDNNGQFAQDFNSSTRLAPTFPISHISEERTNGDIGLGEDFDPKDWALNVAGLASGEPLMLSMNDIKKLPRVEMTTELKCIEGWSIIVNWAGVRFADFAAKYPPATQSGDAPNVKTKPQDLLPYVGLTTPDGGYYVGMDMQSALHPQTLLCYEMNGKPLTSEHGAPLRLVTPVKYGIKHIKRIGSIEYATNRPADYWAEQGYDWYAGH